MADITIQNAKDDLTGKLHGSNVNSITQINRILAAAARIVLTKIDPAETLRSDTIEDVSSATLDYDAPSDLKDRKVRYFGIDDEDEGRPFGSRTGGDFQRPRSNDQQFQIVTLNGTKKIRTYVPHTEERDYEIEYYSNCGFRDGTTWTATITNDDTILNFGETSYDIFLNEALILCAQQLQGENSASDIRAARDALYGGGGDVGLYSAYLEGNPNDTVQPRETYFRML